MGVIDQLKLASEQASSKARETIRETQRKQELAHAYGELGRVTYELVEQGGLVDKRLISSTEHVRDLEAQLSALRGPSKDRPAGRHERPRTP
jgi:hypothetical protein